MKGPTTMSSVEKYMTQNNIELMRQHPEFLKRRESERKFIASSPELLEGFRAGAVPIEQIYLSNPQDEFSLRVRAKHTAHGTEYTATLKDEGNIVDGQLERLEVETAISAETYDYYASQPDLASIKKLRAEPYPGFTIDYIEKLDSPLAEIEQRDDPYPAYIQALTSELVDVTGDPLFLNETLAHTLRDIKSERDNTTPETLDVFVRRVAHDILTHYRLGYKHIVTGISGMSGSGKSSVVAELSRQLEEHFGPEFKPTILSTDDYHKGRIHLEETYGAPWENWDDERVYDTELMASDIARLLNGETIHHRHFDFASEETVIDDPVVLRPLIIVEGIVAGSPDLQDIRQLHFEVPTSRATSIGRDVRRLVLENRVNGSIGSPEARLKYQLETALPTYQGQERPTRNHYSSCARPLAERAFILDGLRDWPIYQ